MKQTPVWKLWCPCIWLHSKFCFLVIFLSYYSLAVCHCEEPVTKQSHATPGQMLLAEVQSIPTCLSLRGACDEAISHSGFASCHCEEPVTKQSQSLEVGDGRWESREGCEILIPLSHFSFPISHFPFPASRLNDCFAPSSLAMTTFPAKSTKP